MLKAVKKFRDPLIIVMIPTSERLTDLTKGIRFAANSVSRAMDTANGGVLKHGGFHRLHGGHSMFDFKMWAKHGVKFPTEVAKDSLTTNGVPLPGTETAVNSGAVKASVAQKWGCLNIGDLAAGAVAAADTCLNARKFVQDREAFDGASNRVLRKATIKLAVASSHGNIPLAVAGACDVGMVAYSKLEKYLEIDFSETTTFGYGYGAA